MEKVELTGWEITINENGVKMATMNHERFINFLKYNEYLEQQVKLLAAPAVSKCVEPGEEGTLIDFFSWLKLKGYLRSNVYAKDIIDLYKSINGC
jgi:hypothetical protein